MLLPSEVSGCSTLRRGPVRLLRHAFDVPPQRLFGQRQIEGIPVRLVDEYAGRPVDLDEVPHRIVEVERKRYAVVEGLIGSPMPTMRRYAARRSANVPTLNAMWRRPGSAKIAI